MLSTPKRHRTNTYVRLIVLACIIALLGLVRYIYFVDKNNGDNRMGDTSSKAQIATETPDIKTTMAANATLQTIIDSLHSEYDDNVSIVLIDLKSGASAASDSQATPFVTASIYKLFVAYGIYQLIDSGALSEDDSLSQYGLTSTISDCLDAMLTISDNTCARALGQLYGWGALDTMLESKGFTNTTINNYDSSGVIIGDKYSTAQTVASFLVKLYKHSLLSDSSTTQFINLLKADEIDYMLPSGLPEGTIIANKVGYLDDYQHDAGIIYGATTDMVVVMLTKGWQNNPPTEAAAAFKQLSEKVWDYMEQV